MGGLFPLDRSLHVTGRLLQLSQFGMDSGEPASPVIHSHPAFVTYNSCPPLKVYFRALSCVPGMLSRELWDGSTP